MKPRGVWIRTTPGRRRPRVRQGVGRKCRCPGKPARGEYSARRAGPVVPGLLFRPGKSGGGAGWTWAARDYASPRQPASARRPSRHRSNCDLANTAHGRRGEVRQLGVRITPLRRAVGCPTWTQCVVSAGSYGAVPEPGPTRWVHSQPDRKVDLSLSSISANTNQTPY